MTPVIPSPSTGEDEAGDGVVEKGGLMENGVWLVSNLERAPPGVLNLIYKPIPAALTDDQRDLFVNLSLQLLGIGLPDFLKKTFQLPIDSLGRFRKDAVKAGDNFNLNDIE